MSHKIMITLTVRDDADYEVIQDNLDDFPEVLRVDPILATQSDKKELTREQKEIRLRLINTWRFHNPDTGFKEFTPKTPQYVKNLLDDIIKEESP